MKIKYAASLFMLFVLFNILQSCKTMNHADLILINGKIITINKEFAVCEGVAITGNKIAAAGTNFEVKKYSGPETKIIDLHGKTVIPGLIDSHLHPESASLSELEEEIPDIHTMDQLLRWIKGQTLTKEKGRWIILQKFFPTRLTEMRQPKLSELDEAAPDHPVFLNGSFGGIINSRAMKMSGITGKTNHPGIILDQETALPTGVIRSSAFGLLKIPPQKSFSNQEKEDALRNMLNRYNQYGITSLLSGAGDLESLKMYRDMADKKILTVRICQNMLLEPGKPVTKASVVEMIKKSNSIRGDGDEWVRTGSLKVYLDGGILTATAYMKEPWGRKAAGIFGIEDPSYRGIVNFTREELAAIVSVANDFNWSFTAHATGEAAVDLLLDVYSDVNRQKPIKGKRFSIIHGNFFSSDAIRKMSELSIYANLQPAWFFKDSEAMDSILGHEKFRIFHPYRSLTDAGIMINGGSDHMVKWDANTSVNPYNPFLAMWTMVTRKTERGSVMLPSEALTREEALKAYTINNAFATFEEKRKGSLEPGKLADLAVLSNDILSCPIDSIKTIKSIMTIVGGKIVYASDTAMLNFGNIISSF
jgi:predicted amidohydrolase YtcJ